MAISYVICAAAAAAGRCCYYCYCCCYQVSPEAREDGDAHVSSTTHNDVEAVYTLLSSSVHTHVFPDGIFIVIAQILSWPLTGISHCFCRYYPAMPPTLPPSLVFGGVDSSAASRHQPVPAQAPDGVFGMLHYMNASVRVGSLARHTTLPFDTICAVYRY